MEPEVLLPHLQDPATCPYPDPDRSSPCPHSAFRRFILILSSVFLTAVTCLRLFKIAK